MINKKIIGYKFKEEFKHLEKEALRIANGPGFTDAWSVSKNIDFSVGSVFHSNLIKAGVLNIWFEPVYEIPTFEVGKWYKKPNSDYGKFLGSEGNKWLCKEYIGVRTQKYYNTGNYYSNEYMDDAILVTDLTEIQQYLPDGHPDKIVTSSKKETDLFTKDQLDLINKMIDNKLKQLQ